MARRPRPRVRYVSKPGWDLKGLARTVNGYADAFREAGQPTSEWDLAMFTEAVCRYIFLVAYWKLLWAFGEADAEEWADIIACKLWQPVLADDCIREWVYADVRKAKPTSFLYRCAWNRAIDVLRTTRKQREIEHLPFDVHAVRKRGSETSELVAFDLATPGALNIEQELILREEFTTFERELLERAMTCEVAGQEMGKSTTSAHTLQRRCREKARGMAHVLLKR